MAKLTKRAQKIGRRPNKYRLSSRWKNNWAFMNFNAIYFFTLLNFTFVLLKKKSWFYFWLFYLWLCHVLHHLPPLLRQPLEDPECWLYQRDQPMRLPAMTEIRCIRTVPSSLVIVGLSNWRQACYAGSVENTISCHETTPLSLSKCPIKSNSNLKLLHKCPTE